MSEKAVYSPPFIGASEGDNGGMHDVIRKHHFSMGDCLVAVSERANGGHLYPTLFFIHGRFGHSEMWWPIVDRLFPRFRCFSLDLPGYGESFSVRERGLSLLEHSKIVCELIDRLVGPNERAVLIGHDVGGAIAQICALELKRKLSGVVLINCSGLANPVKGMKAGWFGWSARKRLSRLLRSAGQSKNRVPFRSLMLEPWRYSSSKAALIRALRAFEFSWPGPFERQKWRKELKSLDIPSLLLWGSKDPLNDSEVGLQMVRELPDAYLFESETTGHWPNLEDPDWVADKILEFTFRLAGPSSLLDRVSS